MLPSSSTLSDGAQLLVEQGISSIPVIDNMGTPMGFLSEFSLIRCYLKLHQSKEKNKDQIYHFRELLEPMALVPAEATLQEAIRILFSSPFHRALVEGANGKIVGIICPKDILKVLTNDRHSISKFESELVATKKDLRNVAGKLKDAEEILSRYHAYLENAPFHIHSVNEEGKVVFANRSLRKALDYDSNEIIGMNLDELYSPDHAEDAKKGLEKIRKNGGHEPVITSMLCKNGDEYRVEAITSAVNGPDGKFIATITMSRRLAADNMLRALNGVLDTKKNAAFG